MDHSALRRTQFSYSRIVHFWYIPAFVYKFIKFINFIYHQRFFKGPPSGIRPMLWPSISISRGCPGGGGSTSIRYMSADRVFCHVFLSLPTRAVPSTTNLVVVCLHSFFGIILSLHMSISVRNSTCPLVRDKWLFTRTSKQSVSSYPLVKWKLTARLYSADFRSKAFEVDTNPRHSEWLTLPRLGCLALKILCNAYPIRTVCQLGQWPSYQYQAIERETLLPIVLVVNGDGQDCHRLLWAVNCQFYFSSIPTISEGTDSGCNLYSDWV